MFFLVEDNKTSVNPLSFDKELIKSSTKVENLGNYQALGTVSTMGMPNAEINNYDLDDTNIEENDVEGDATNG